MSHSSRPSDDGDFLGLEERMSFDEDVALQEPLVPEELKGAYGGQEVALQRIQTGIPRGPVAGPKRTQGRGPSPNRPVLIK